MATKNSINNISNPIEAENITIDPGASGDSYIQCDINTTGKFRYGVDDDASDAFKISSGSALGGTDYYTLSANGERNIALQPVFSAHLSSSQNDVSGDSTYYTIIFDTESYDIGGNYNNSTGVFTAPVTGIYLLTYSILYKIDVSGGTTSLTLMYTSNSYYQNNYMPTRNLYNLFFGANGFVGASDSRICDMDSSDTAYVQFYSAGGSKLDDVLASGSSTIYTYFTGYLIG